MKTLTRNVDKVEIEFHIGQNAQENFDLIDTSDPDDLWFHISQESSCHVIATIPEHLHRNKKALKKIAIQGGVICKQFSRYKSMKNVSIIYAPIQQVEKTDIIGTVSVKEYKTLVI